MLDLIPATLIPVYGTMKIHQILTNERGDIIHKVLPCSHEICQCKLCVVRYDDVSYPGKIVDVEENDILVSCMHICGKNKFYWPNCKRINTGTAIVMF